VSTLLAILYLLFSSAVEAWTAEWEFCAKSGWGYYYYDPQSIKRVSKDTIQVWEKAVYTEKGVQDMVKDLGPKYIELSYTLQLCEFNCSEKKSRILSATFYNNEGGIIGSFSYPTTWEFVVPESVDEHLFNIVCGSH